MGDSFGAIVRAVEVEIKLMELVEKIRGEDLITPVFQDEAKEGSHSYTGLEYSFFFFF